MTTLVTSTMTALPTLDGTRYQASWTSPAGLVLESLEAARTTSAVVYGTAVRATLARQRGDVSWVPRRSVDDWSLRVEGEPVSVRMEGGGPLRAARFHLVWRDEAWVISCGSSGPAGQWLQRAGEAEPVATAGGLAAGWLRFRDDVTGPEAALAVLLRTRLMAATTRFYFLAHLS